MIKFTNKKVINVWDWDDLVTTTYGKPYSFQQQDDCKPRGTFDFEVPNKWGIEDYENDTIPFIINGREMGVSFKSWLNTSEEDIKKEFPERDSKMGLSIFWGRNFYPHVDIIIDDLYKKGLIEEGKYTINIDW